MPETTKPWADYRGTEGYYRLVRYASGFFGLVDPDNQPFFYRGVCAVNRAGEPGGRLAKPGVYADTCKRLYGDDTDRFVASCIRRTIACGFNAFGSWTTDEFFNRGVCFTETLEFTKIDESVRLRGKGIRLPDVFDPKWDLAARALCEQLVPPLVTSRDLLGYFVDNELGWGQAKTDHVWGAGDNVNTDGSAPTLLQFCLSLPEDRAAHSAAWNFLEERYTSAARALASWGIETTDDAARADVRRMSENGMVFSSETYGRDHEAFTRLFAERYVRRVCEEIRRIDPNHLILGCRFGAPPGEAVARAQDIPGGFDVCSINNYRDTFYDRISDMAGETDLPILNGEFSWNSDYFALDRRPGDAGLSEKERIARHGPKALESAVAHPRLVGYTWYRWVHNFTSPEDRSYGIVNREGDILNRFNASLLASVNPRLESIRNHAGGISGS
ncbi:MAG: hypothetical protein ACOC4F_01460 [bacterium]